MPAIITQSRLFRITALIAICLGVSGCGVPLVPLI